MTADPPTAWDPAFHELYRTRYDPMVRLAFLITRRAAVAEEVVQDAFVRVHERWSSIETPTAYLRATVVNGCRSWLRRQALRAREVSHLEVAPPADHEADELWDALASLPERQRLALILRFYEDLPDDEIAAVLDCRRSTVRTSIHRGLAALRRQLTEETDR